MGKAKIPRPICKESSTIRSDIGRPLSEGLVVCSGVEELPCKSTRLHIWRIPFLEAMSRMFPSNIWSLPPPPPPPQHLLLIICFFFIFFVLIIILWIYYIYIYVYIYINILYHHYHHYQQHSLSSRIMFPNLWCSRPWTPDRQQRGPRGFNLLCESSFVSRSRWISDTSGVRMTGSFALVEYHEFGKIARFLSFLDTGTRNGLLDGWTMMSDTNTTSFSKSHERLDSAFHRAFHHSGRWVMPAPKWLTNWLTHYTLED